jgi:hypothetical protein
MSIPATREAIYWLLCDINAIVGTAIEAFEAGDMQALRTELKGCADCVREEIEVLEEETPEIENSQDPRDQAASAPASD